MLFIYAWTIPGYLFFRGHSSLLTICWNVGGVLHCPKYMTFGCQCPSGVQKAAFHLSPSWMHMLLYPDLILNLVEKGVSLKFFHDMFDVREWILIPYCLIVDQPVILYWAIGAILLFNTKAASSIRGFEWFDISFYKLFLHPVVHEFSFWRAEGIDFAL